MSKTILITGSTDGIGLETAGLLLEQGHKVLLHGRNPEKLAKVEAMFASQQNSGVFESYIADLSDLSAVERLAQEVSEKNDHLDVLINNAGVLKVRQSLTESGLDIRFMVNTIAPYLLTQKLLPLMNESGRVINLSSAAQAPVNLDALGGKATISNDMGAYAQSKLAITMWSKQMADDLGDSGPAIIAVNPGSYLATKMVKEGFGMEGNNIRIGADILIRAALSDEFASASGDYFDNDLGRFALPHADVQNVEKCEAVVGLIEEMIMG